MYYFEYLNRDLVENYYIYFNRIQKDQLSYVKIIHLKKKP